AWLRIAMPFGLGFPQFIPSLPRRYRRGVPMDTCLMPSSSNAGIASRDIGVVGRAIVLFLLSHPLSGGIELQVLPVNTIQNAPDGTPAHLIAERQPCYCRPIFPKANDLSHLRFCELGTRMGFAVV